jgi:O-antigen/teichoic acid export membrane protein
MIIKNLSWLTVSQVARMVTGLLVGTWVTRTLGPEQAGLLGTAAAMGAVISFVAEMGLRQVLIKEFSMHQAEQPIIFGTAVRLMAMLGLLAYVGTCTFIAWKEGPEMLRLALVLFTPLLWNPYLAVLSRWDAEGQAQRTARLAMTASLTAAALRAVFLYLGKDLYWVAVSIALETLLTASACFVWCQKKPCLGELWLWDSTTAWRLLNQAFPLLLAHSGTLLLLRADQIMIYQMCGDAEAGIYSAATRLSEIVYASGPMVIMVFMPMLTRSQEKDSARYQQQRALLFGAVSMMAYGSMLFWWLAGDWLVALFYGPKFAPAAAVLMVHGLAALPYLQGELRGAALVIEGRTMWSVRCALVALILNLMLNLWLIPAHGALGAAWATVAAYAVAWLLSSMVVPTLWSFGREQARALISPCWFWSTLRQWRQIWS